VARLPAASTSSPRQILSPRRTSTKGITTRGGTLRGQRGNPTRWRRAPFPSRRRQPPPHSCRPRAKTDRAPGRASTRQRHAPGTSLPSHHDRGNAHTRSRSSRDDADHGTHPGGVERWLRCGERWNELDGPTLASAPRPEADVQPPGLPPQADDEDIDRFFAFPHRARSASAGNAPARLLPGVELASGAPVEQHGRTGCHHAV
jgi:hypothetical protein